MSAESADTSRITVAVVTGFLGSGKTTVLNWLIRQPQMGRTAVIVNEFGEIGIDNDLIERSDETTILLGSGCLCCTVRGDLVETLKDLSLRRMSGEVPPFSRVVIETTGLADPAAVLHALMSLPVAARYRLDTVITTVDAVHAGSTLDKHREAVRQVAVADRIILTKTDLVEPPVEKRVRDRLASINPGASVTSAIDGRIDVGIVLDSHMYDTTTKPPDVADWIGLDATDPHQHHGHDDHHSHGPGAHDTEIRADSFIFHEPLSWGVVTLWLDRLAARHGEKILRMKAIADIEDNEKAVVLHAVQHLFHPPIQIDGFPGDERRSRFVFITQDLAREEIERFLSEAQASVKRLSATKATAEPRPMETT